MGRDPNFIQESEAENGRKITIMFERWLQMFEARSGTWSDGYPFTLIELVGVRSALTQKVNIH